MYGQNRPVVTGPTSFCSNPQNSTYTIENYVTNATFNIRVIPAGSATVGTSNFNIQTGTFTINWAARTNGTRIIIIPTNIANPTNDTILLHGCCTPPTGDAFYIDPIFTTTFTGAQQINGEWVFEGGVNGAPAIFHLFGQLRTPNVGGTAFVIKNCTIKVAEGASIFPVNTSSINTHIYFENVVFRKSCDDSQWQGIISKSPSSFTGVHFDDCDLINATSIVTAYHNTLIDIKDNVTVKYCEKFLYSPNKNTPNTIIIEGENNGNLIIDGSHNLPNPYAPNPAYSSNPTRSHSAILVMNSIVNPPDNGVYPYTNIEINDINAGIIGYRSTMNFTKGITFEDVQGRPEWGGNKSYNANAGFNGVAIFSNTENSTTSKTLKIGGTNTGDGITFTQCFAGVRAYGQQDINIHNSLFDGGTGVYQQKAIFIDRNINKTVNIVGNDVEHCDKGFELRSVRRCDVNISDNDLTDFNYTPAQSGLSYLGNTGILVSSVDQEVYLDINGNNISDARNGIHVNGIRPASLPYSGWGIRNNVITLTSAHSNITASTTLTGILVDNSEFGEVYNNNVKWCSPSDPNCLTRYAHSTNSIYDYFVRGCNFRGVRNVEVKENFAGNVGEGMQFAGNCNSTYLRCNEINNASRGIYFLNASMSNQGASGHALDNEWVNVSGNKIQGDFVNAGGITWYYQNSGTYNISPYFTSPSLTPFPTSSNNPCSSGGTNDPEKIEKIVDDSIVYVTYEEYAPYSDRDYAYVKLYDDSTFRVSQNKFVTYYDNNYQTNIEKYREVKELLRRGTSSIIQSKLDSIYEENNIEYSMKVTMSEWSNIMADINYVISDSSELESIAYTDCWRGGDAVFHARAILGLEVNDQPNGLRIGKNENAEFVNIFPNPANDFINFGQIFKKICIFDNIGRIVIELKNVNEAKVDKLKPGLYSVKCEKYDKSLSKAKFIKL